MKIPKRTQIFELLLLLHRNGMLQYQGIDETIAPQYMIQ